LFFTASLLLRQGLFGIEPPKKQGRARPENRCAPIPFEKYKLKNGLEVIFSEDHRLPLVAVYVLYHVGPANERPAGPASPIYLST